MGQGESPIDEPKSPFVAKDGDLVRETFNFRVCPAYRKRLSRCRLADVGHGGK